MKKTLSLSILMLLTFGATPLALAQWFPGNGILWIKHMDTPGVDSASRYTAGTYNGRSGHLDTLTGLKWATNNQNTSVQWAIDNSYGEPTWNGTSYTYPSGRVATDYPAFKHCTDLGGGWRLPTRKELQSIISRAKTLSPYSFLPNVASARYWSSGQYRANTANAWLATMGVGQVYDYSKNGSSRALCVSE